ncbi:nucleotidyltransferase family protein [Argonema galeatum]|uniref:nucleotidyltransferase family protein n=1 Tax=Argonema galeatum TaxID=2942762 RepID=UPI0020112C85|nr:nucleotidyltransferase family protein [Argonema galeatum]MCL1467392.1 nucleotidyltransferase family protein [Argonema galeatum A003/A1]
MNSKNDRKFEWVTSEQELLLRSALKQGKDATDAWQQWKRTVDIEDLDPESYRLLPLLYRNLSVHGVSDSHMVRLKGVYRRRWYENQLLVSKITSLLRSFQDAGIEILILKDVALLLHYYQDDGLHAIDSFDVFVRWADGDAALGLLNKLGWMLKEKVPDKVLSSLSVITFVDESGKILNLYRHIYWYPWQENTDLGEGPIATQIKDLSTYVLNPTYQLLQLCHQGTIWHLVPPIRLVADGMTIINSFTDSIDWDVLVADAEKYRFILSLKKMITILSEVLLAPIPGAIIEKVRDLKPSAFEQMEYQVSAGEPLPVIKTFIIRYSQYLKSVQSTGSTFKIMGFPRYLQDVWGLDNLWSVPFQVTVKGMKRIRNDIFK